MWEPVDGFAVLPPQVLQVRGPALAGAKTLATTRAEAWGSAIDRLHLGRSSGLCGTRFRRGLDRTGFSGAYDQMLSASQDEDGHLFRP